ncbi:unnamed protein product [Mortierella alpina]
MQLPPPAHRTFADLPTEVQLHILLLIPTERELLHFRLVSSLANSLVLEPVFWRHITFSKQLYLTARRKQPAASHGLATHPPAMTAAHPSAPPIRAGFHNSDAHLIVHRLSSQHPIASTVPTLEPTLVLSSSADQHAPHPRPVVASPRLAEPQASALSEASEDPMGHGT